MIGILRCFVIFLLLAISVRTGLLFHYEISQSFRTLSFVSCTTVSDTIIAVSALIVSAVLLCDALDRRKHKHNGSC